LDASLLVDHALGKEILLLTLKTKLRALLLLWLHIKATKERHQWVLLLLLLLLHVGEN